MGTKTIKGTSRISIGLSGSTLYSNAWRAFFSIIDSQVTDPSSRNEKWIYAGYPDQKIKDTTDASNKEIKSEYPILIVNSITTSHSPITLPATTKQFANEIEIDVYSSRTDTLDSLFGLLDYELSKNETETFLAELNIFDLNLLSSNTDFMLRGGVKIHVKELVYGFNVNESR